MDSSEAIGWLTFALVLVTAYYAWQNQRMVGEMREARRLSVQPKLSVSMFFRTTTFAYPRLVNVGQGPALDVDVNLVFVRRDVPEVEERVWRATVMPPGEEHDFFPPDVQQIEDTRHLARLYREIKVVGTMKSSLGDSVEVDETTGDLQEWSEMSSAVSHVWDEEPHRKLADELEKIRRKFETWKPK